MLGQFKARSAFHAQALKNSWILFVDKPWSSLLTTLVIAVTLTLPALFWIVANNLQILTKDWQQSNHINLYLTTSISPADEHVLLEKIQSTEGVERAELKSAADGLAELQQQEGMRDIMQFLPENPLPSVIEVFPETSVDTSEKLKQLQQALKSYAQVEQVNMDMEWMNRLYSVINFIKHFAHGLMFLLALAVILIVSNTLRPAIQQRHEEIQVLKLIGASDSYIIRPFLYFGIWYGITGALLAIITVCLFVQRLSSQINQFIQAYNMQYTFLSLSFMQSLVFVGIAISLGWLGARISVKNQLAPIEPGTN